MPAPNLRPDFEQQAKTFADGLADRMQRSVGAVTEV